MKIATNLAVSFLLLAFIPMPRLFAQGGGVESVTPWAITGTWNIVEGSYQGRSYNGLVEITTGKDAFNFHWNLGTTEYNGVGLALGGYVGVGWGGDGGRCGLAIYQILSDSILVGAWTSGGDDYPLGHERARGGSLTRKQSTFAVEGTNPNEGSAYTGSLKLARKGDSYDVVWKIGKDTYYGVGIRQGDVFVVGWGVARDNIGVVAYKFDMEHATGRWALPGGATLGIENLKRQTAGATPGR